MGKSSLLAADNASNNSILREISENASSNANSRRTDKSGDNAGKIKLHPSISTKSILISTEGKDKNNKNGRRNTSQEQSIVSSSNSTSNSNKNQRNIGLPPKSILKIKKINLNQSQAYTTNPV